MKKLLALLALVGLVAFNVDARRPRRGCYDSGCKTECRQECPVECTPCEPQCEMSQLPDVVQCEPKPACRTIVCAEPRRVCTTQKVVRCHWVCPPNCKEFTSEKHAEAADFTKGGNY